MFFVKIRFMILLVMMAVGLQASGSSEFNSLGVFYPNKGNPLISVKLWNEGKSKIEESIKCFSILEKQWPRGEFICIISPYGNEMARVTTLHFDTKTGRYQEQKKYPDNLYKFDSLPAFSLDECSYVVCIPDTCNYNFLSPCADFLNKAYQKKIEIVIHFSYLTSKSDRKMIESVLTYKKEYREIDSKKTDNQKTEKVIKLAIDTAVETAQERNVQQSKDKATIGGYSQADLVFLILALSMLAVCVVPLIAILANKI